MTHDEGSAAPDRDSASPPAPLTKRSPDVTPGERARAVIDDEEEWDLEPQLPEIHLADVLCVGPILANSLYGLLGRPVTFLLVKSHILTLLFIRPTLYSLIAAGAAIHGGQIGWVPALLLPLPFLFMDDPFLYWAGRRYGPRLSNHLIEQDPRWEARIRRGERIMERWGVWAIIACNIPFVPIPISVIYFLAGDSRMNIPLFCVVNLISLEIFVASTLYLGYRLGNAAQNVVNVVGNYSTVLFWVSMAAIVVYVVFSTRRNMRVMRERQRTRRPRD